MSLASPASGVPAAEEPVAVLKPLMLTAREAQSATGLAVSSVRVQCYEVTGVNQCSANFTPPAGPPYPSIANIASFPTTAEAKQAVRSAATTNSGDLKYKVLKRTPSTVTYVLTMPFGQSVTVLRQVGNRLIQGTCAKPEGGSNTAARACATALAAAQVAKAK